MVSREVGLGDLIAFGRALGAGLSPGEVVWLEGELGAGKTTLVQAIVEGLGVVGGATSPTYSLVHRYQGHRGPVYHVDCYRLKRPDEGRDLDWETMATADAVLVEWPDKAGPWALEPTRRLGLAHLADPDRRQLVIG